MKFVTILLVFGLGSLFTIGAQWAWRNWGKPFFDKKSFNK